MIDSQSPQQRLTNQGGIYERGLLCSECDGSIGFLDNYAYSVLPEIPDESKIQPLPELKKLSIYKIGEIDVPKFHQFIVSLVWRSGISNAPFFKHVKLGPFEARLRDYLLAGILHLKPEVGVVITLFRPPDFDKIMWPPSRVKFDGINVFIFYLYPWKLVIKLDRRPFNHPFDKLSLSAGLPALAVIQNFLSRGEIAALLDVRNKVRNALTM